MVKENYCATTGRLCKIHFSFHVLLISSDWSVQNSSPCRTVCSPTSGSAHTAAVAQSSLSIVLKEKSEKGSKRCGCTLIQDVPAIVSLVLPGRQQDAVTLAFLASYALLYPEKPGRAPKADEEGLDEWQRVLWTRWGPSCLVWSCTTSATTVGVILRPRLKQQKAARHNHLGENGGTSLHRRM